MPDTTQEWIERYRYIKHRLDVLRAGNALTQEMLHRSRDQLARSQELLQTEMPKIWPDPSRGTDRPSTG